MRALLCSSFGGVETLELADLPEPKPKAGEVLIDVAAGALNFADSLMIAGKYQVKPALPFVPGMELSGHVVALGTDVAGCKIGDKVMAVVDQGAFAARAIAKAADVFPLPPNLDFAAAAGFPIAYGTAYGALAWKARLKAGEWLLVHGAAGGVGLTAVEIGKALGARIIATAGSAEKCRTALAHGADAAIDYGTEDIRQRVKDLTGGDGVDVVFDPVGGGVFEASLRSVAWGARLIVVGFAGGTVQQIPANILLVKNVDVLGFYWGSYRRQNPDLVHESFRALGRMLASGQLKPHVLHRFPLEAWRAAFDLLLSRRSTGKVVLEM